MPRQQLHDAIDRMLGDTLENIAQVGFRIELIELGRTDERVDNGRALTAAVSTGEEIIFSAESNRAKRAFRGIVVDLDSSIIAISCEGFLAGVNYFFRRRQLFLPVLSLHHWSTIAQSDARSVRSSGSEISARLRL